MEVLNPEYLNTFTAECDKIEKVLQVYNYKKSDKLGYYKDNFLIKYTKEFIHQEKKINLYFSYCEYFPARIFNNKSSYSLNLYIDNFTKESKSFYLSTYLEDQKLEKSIITRYKDGQDFNQTIRDFFQHTRRLLANELKETLLGNEVHDHAERAMQSYIDHIYDSPTLANNLYQKQIDDYRKKMSIYDRFIEWNSRLIANLEIRFFRFITPFLRFLNSLFEDKK